MGTRWRALYLGLWAGTLAAAPPPTSLWSALREGGLVVFIPPGASTRSPAAGRIPVSDCQHSPRLTADGWQQALTYGIAFRKQEVQVERVYSGWPCDQRHTGFLMFGADKVHSQPVLASDCDGLTPAHRRAFQQLLNRPPAFANTNHAVIGPTCLLPPEARQGVGECDARLGGAWIFKPMAGETPRLLGCLTPEELLTRSQEPRP